MDMIAFESLPIDVREQILTSLCQHSEEGIFILDSNFCFKWVNLSYENIIGYSINYLHGKTISVYPLNELRKYPKSLIRRIRTSLLENQYFQDDVSYTTCYNTHFTTNLTIWGVECYAERYYVGLLRDIVAAEDTARAHQQAINYNPITALPNRHYLITQFNTLITSRSPKLALVILSIDKFRMISNTLNEVDKNNLVKQIVWRLQSISLNHLQVFSHFNDNDFALLFDTIDEDIILQQLEKIVSNFQRPFAVAEHNFHLKVSMGVGIFPDHGKHLDTISRSAEIALYAVKNSGGNGIRIYDEVMNQKTLEQLKLETELHNAFKLEQFLPYYQPKVDLKTGVFIGFEALVRWNHPEQGLLGASQFVQTIIDNHLTFSLFKLMAKAAVMQLHEWREQGHPCSICLNVDAAEFRHPNFISYLQQLMVTYPGCISYLHIEITETSLLVNDEVATNILNSLRQVGISIALDDFGTGYSSLSYLQNYDFDSIKIDKRFITDIHKKSKNFAIVSAIVSLAHNMNMKVVAEGIESIEQIDELNRIGCDYGQGYLFGKPLSKIQATELLLGCGSSITDEKTVKS